jgi:outer membrane protein OmpA-like peptidoglycan-associated protein
MYNSYKIIALLAFCFFTKNLSAQLFSNVSISNVSAINTGTYDFSPTFYKDGIVFVSNNETNNKHKMFDNLFRQKTMSLFIASRNSDGQLSKPKLFAKELVSRVHEGPLAFEKDFKTVYISRNDNRKRSGKAKYEDNDVDHMKIYVSQQTTKGWSKPKLLTINDRQSDACHPTLSPDGKRMYFSSNRKGGFGGMDLYVTEKVNGKWSKPVNLGAKINSEKNDVFPYVHSDGTFYFSSDKAGGNGGLDIYYCALNEEKKSNLVDNFNTPPLSIGAPFNSENDDFGFILEANGKNGYFTSNRNGGAGSDDIYYFDVPNEKLVKPETPAVVDVEKPKEVVVEKPTQPLTLKIVNKRTGLPVKGADIFTAVKKSQNGVNSPSNTQKVLTSNDNGLVNMTIMPNDSYMVTVSSEGYNTKQMDYDSDKKTPEMTIYLEELNPSSNSIVEKPNTVPPVVAETKPAPTTVALVSSNSSIPMFNERVYELKNIYYNFDDASIRKDAANTLDSLANILKQYPDMHIELASHTDIRGSNAYNEKLSDRRAKSAAAYLRKRGIDPTRLKLVPYGKRQLVIDCGTGSGCSEGEHKLNRRTEVRVIRIEK